MSNIGVNSKKIKKDLLVIILLIGCLGFSTFSLVYADSIEKAYNINLNDGLPVVEEDNLKISPGKKIERKFFIQNEGDKQLKYTLYFENVEGTLGEVILATFYDGNKVILSGLMNEIAKSKLSDVTGTLKPYEKKYLKVVFSFPKEISNDYKNSTLMFDIGAIAVWPS